MWSPVDRIGLCVTGTADVELLLWYYPDSTAALFVDGDGTRLACVSINCADLEPVRHVYCYVMGLGVQRRARRAGPLPRPRLRVEGSVM